VLGLDVYDYAFLRGGPRAAFFAALGDLEHRGCLKVAASRATALARPSADVGPLPQAIFAAAERWPDSTASELGGDPDVAAALAAIERKLTSRDLWRNGRRIGLGFAPIPTIWIAGASAAAVYALSTQRRLENAVATFVVVGAAVLALFLLARAALGRGAGPTALGKRVLEDARRSRTPAAAPRDARTAAARHGATPMLDPLWQFALWGPLLHGSPAFAAGAFPPGAGGLPWATGGSVDAWSVGVDGSLSESASASAWSADSGASTSVEPMFGGGSSGGGFGGDWSSGGGADSGGGGFDGGGGGGGGDSGGGGGGGGD
jgi:uncharacterized protein (TIGR04222 family)